MKEESFAERFELMLSGGQISQKAIDLTKETVSNIEEKFNIELGEHNANMFITHLVLTVERLITGQELNEIPPLVVDEIKGYKKEFDFMTRLMEKTSNQGCVKIPEAEIAFLTAHLCAITRKDEVSWSES